MIDLDYRKQLWSKGYWEIPEGLDITNFDFSWRPEPYDRPYIHQFGTQHQKTGGPRFVIPENEGIKYQTSQHAIRLPTPDLRNWRPLISNIAFDYSWHPDDTEPPFIYVFGNQWHDSVTMPTMQYKVSGATEKKYIDTIKATLTPDKTNWIIPDDIEDDFDYSWVPSPNEPPLIWEFGTQHQKTGGPSYVAKNGVHTKYSSELIATKKGNKEDRCWRPLLPNIDFDFSWHPDKNDPPYIYVFGNQWYDSLTMPTLLYRVKGATEKKYMTDIKITLTPNKSMWTIPDDIEDDFDYSWLPHPDEPAYIWQFGTQWQKNGGPKYNAPGANTLKHSDLFKATKKPNVRNWRFIEPVDRETFDFSWHPDETEESFNHIIGTKFHTPEIMPALMYRGHKDAKSNKYNIEIQADLQIDKIVYEDSIFDACKDHKFSTAYAHFVKGPNNYSHDLIKSDNISVHLFPSEAIVPRDAIQYMYDKLSDYDYVIEHKFEETVTPLDVIFFSNGEACADANYEHLLSLNLPNRIVRIDGVKGRVASQHAAANASNTPWYFLVNAKLKVRDDFDFNWQPNIYKSRRHYIFRATNPVNGLVYGHQAIVANNKKLTLNTVVRGLDFTMDSSTEVVNINSGIAMYNTSKWDTWRTAFRECIKLSHATDDESKKRLQTWSTVGEGAFSEYSIKGAIDAISYFNSVNGEFDKLMLSYDWEWLYQYYQNNCP